MKSAAIFMLLSGIAMLLEFPVDCTLCPLVKENVYAFLNGTTEQYKEIINNNTDNQAIKQNGLHLKACIDSKLTAEDKDAAISLVNKIIASKYCIL